MQEVLPGGGGPALPEPDRRGVRQPERPPSPTSTAPAATRRPTRPCATARSWRTASGWRVRRLGWIRTAPGGDDTRWRTSAVRPGGAPVVQRHGHWSRGCSWRPGAHRQRQGGRPARAARPRPVRSEPNASSATPRQLRPPMSSRVQREHQPRRADRRPPAALRRSRSPSPAPPRTTVGCAGVERAGSDQRRQSPRNRRPAGSPPPRCRGCAAGENHDRAGEACAPALETTAPRGPTARPATAVVVRPGDDSRASAVHGTSLSPPPSASARPAPARRRGPGRPRGRW